MKRIKKTAGIGPPKLFDYCSIIMAMPVRRVMDAEPELEPELEQCIPAPDLVLALALALVLVHMASMLKEKLTTQA